MMSYSAARRWLGCFLFACGTAQAVTVDLGEIVAPLSWQIAHDSSEGPFLDRFTFAIVADQHLMFSSFVTTGFSRRSSIAEFRGELFSDGVLLDTGDAQTTYMPEGFPSQSVNFDTLLLGMGDYELRFSGTAYSFDPLLHFGAGYKGSAEFRAAQAVPEPSTLLLAGLGLTALAWSGFAKQRATGAAFVSEGTAARLAAAAQRIKGAKVELHAIYQ